ncbi:hypothetical protein BC829DRAFT_393578 [Chytridium lagenaria]|nr:hypothetical protein BC829DRAFT_393578 [Chytridium lagenaria]
MLTLLQRHTHLLWVQQPPSPMTRCKMPQCHPQLRRWIPTLVAKQPPTPTHPSGCKMRAWRLHRAV